MLQKKSEPTDGGVTVIQVCPGVEAVSGEAPRCRSASTSHLALSSSGIAQFWDTLFFLELDISFKREERNQRLDFKEVATSKKTTSKTRNLNVNCAATKKCFPAALMTFCYTLTHILHVFVRYLMASGCHVIPASVRSA